MSEDFDLEVRRRSGSYLIVARDVGVIVKSADLHAGLEEARERIALAKDLYREAGLQPERAEPMPSSTKISWRDVLAPALVSGLTLSGLLLFASVPMVGAVARLTAAIGEARSGIDAGNLGRSTVDSIVALGNTMDKVTPERKQELRIAVRRIMGGLSPVIEEIRAGTKETDGAGAPPPH
jgi:hypothetical protein